MWAHNLYPRLQFSDFARTILKTTANPRVKAKLHEWQDEHREKTDEYARIAREQGISLKYVMDYGLTQYYYSRGKCRRRGGGEWR